MNPSVLIFGFGRNGLSAIPISISRIDIINMLIECANLCACQRPQKAFHRDIQTKPKHTQFDDFIETS